MCAGLAAAQSHVQCMVHPARVAAGGGWGLLLTWPAPAPALRQPALPLHCGCAGVHYVCVTVKDVTDNLAAAFCLPDALLVFDPSGGFALGSGRVSSPAGAYIPPSGTDAGGVAQFGLNARWGRRMCVGCMVPAWSAKFA